MRFTQSVLGLVVVSVASGCATQKLHEDHDKIRATLLDLYTNQIMDNLVRASNGLPIIQLDYSNAAATITLKKSATVDYSHSATDNRVLALPAAARTLTDTVVNGFSGKLGGDHTNQVALTATPVITANEVYDAYLEFLSLPGSLIVSPEAPPCGAAHIWIQYGDLFYWVPVEYKKEFLKLSLLTTARRGQALRQPDDYFTVTLREIVKDEAGQFEGTRHLTIEIDRKIPNDLGRLEFSDDNKLIQYEVKSYDGDAPDQIPPSMTNKLVVVFAPSEGEAIRTVRDLKNKFPLPVKVYLQHEQPKMPTMEELLERANFQLEQLRFNQLREGGL